MWIGDKNKFVSKLTEWTNETDSLYSSVLIINKIIEMMYFKLRYWERLLKRMNGLKISLQNVWEETEKIHDSEDFEYWVGKAGNTRW